MNLCSILLLLWLSVTGSSASYIAEGKASFYSDRMQGHRTANGERYNKTLLTAAHATLPFNTKVRVTNLKNGKSVVVKINDRMARNRHNIIDLSKAAAKQIDIIRAGYGTVKLTHAIGEETEQQAAPPAVTEGDAITK
ncbi:septal ring lytic transglycosylase RlpA family protein [Pontibacter arcticus]|uniref:Probable endolytic peptidoglycan transglycosylase RlpA n=1 Tax=Pontibacter arcticus TaxID=2080288 RepID=A0A364RFK0_9BACT|nr:septal ring lytic transglycosylase RlpA family protein [Pontibacter arcticus]RAU83063.1 septal ring lytic transglycosylase RlpA family lipoprotein [Pontibacter arcticus]